MSETPVARKSSPSPGSARAISGRSAPSTSENPTPAFSKSAPPARSRVRPPPPPGRVQASSRKRPPPSTASSADVMRSCSPRKNSRARSAIGGRLDTGTSAPHAARGLQRHDPPFHVPESRIAFANIFEEVERLAHVPQLLEHRSQQIVELDRLLGRRLRQVERLLVALHGLAELPLRLHALADHRVSEDSARLVDRQLLELLDGGVVEAHLLVGNAEIAVGRGIRVLRRG